MGDSKRAADDLETWPSPKYRAQTGIDKRSAVDRVASKPKHWEEAEDLRLREAVDKFGEKKWKEIALYVKNRNHTQCFQRWYKVLCPGLKKGRWSETEDEKLMELAMAQQEPRTSENKNLKINWGIVAKKIIGRTAKQCRERWVNNLNPAIVRGNWNHEEDSIILELSSNFPKKWALMAKQLPGRTENAVKIRYYSLLRKQKRDSEGDSKGGTSSGGKSKKSKRKASDSSRHYKSMKSDAFPVQSPSAHLNRTTHTASHGLLNGQLNSVNGAMHMSPNGMTMQQTNGAMGAVHAPMLGQHMHPQPMNTSTMPGAHTMASSPALMFSPNVMHPTSFSTAPGNTSVQVQQAMMLIQQNEAQIELLQHQTKALQKVVDDSRRMSQGNVSTGTGNELLDDMRREKFYELLQNYFEKHDKSSVSDDAIGKVIDWTKQNGFEALNSKLRSKHNESFTDFLVSTVNAQQQMNNNTRQNTATSSPNPPAMVQQHGMHIMGQMGQHPIYQVAGQQQSVNTNGGMYTHMNQAQNPVHMYQHPMTTFVRPKEADN